MTKRLKSIIKDFYYRIKSLPIMFLFWILIIVWKRRVQKRHDILSKNRLMLDEIWLISSRLKGDKFNHQRKKLKKFERGFLRLEDDLRKDEEMFIKREEQFKYYIGKVFDPKIGE